jgi:superoxide dismutase, Fe-Mn family
MTHKLPDLPYGFDALEPHIDEETMKIHHGKHHQTYVDKLNAALEKYPDLADKDVNTLISDLDIIPDEIKQAVRSHGGGHSNHSIFWQIMGPDAGGEPNGPVLDSITEAFGNFETFKDKFSKLAAAVFGSGWCWLVSDPETKELAIMTTPNQDSPLMVGKTPLLGIDLWEHAYYLRYNANRPEYINAFWNVVNWGKVDEFFERAGN